MYCKNCGAQMDEMAAVCVNCGTAKGVGAAYCQNCGKEVAPGAAVCLSCGVATSQQAAVAVGGKNKIAAALLAFFLGALGVHNFYLGYKKKAIAQLLITVLTCGAGSMVSGIWALVEFIQILTGSISTDADGVPLV